MFPEEEEKTDPSLSFPLDGTTAERPSPSAEPVARTIALDSGSTPFPAGAFPNTVALPSGEYAAPDESPSNVSKVSMKSPPQAPPRPVKDISVGALVGLGALTFLLSAGVAFAAVWALVSLA